MKKTFVNPEMNISLFEKESIVTTLSNGVEADNKLNSLGINTANVTTIDVDGISWVW